MKIIMIIVCDIDAFIGYNNNDIYWFIDSLLQIQVKEKSKPFVHMISVQFSQLF